MARPADLLTQTLEPTVKVVPLRIFICPVLMYSRYSVWIAFSSGPKAPFWETRYHFWNQSNQSHQLSPHHRSQGTTIMLENSEAVQAAKMLFRK